MADGPSIGIESTPRVAGAGLHGLDANSARGVAPAAPVVLWIDPDFDGTEAQAHALRRLGFLVHRASSLEDPAEQVGRLAANLIILDAETAARDGFAVCERLATAQSTPLMILAAQDCAMDHIGCLEAGADDYVLKTAHHLEFAARAKALVRRHRRWKDGEHATTAWRLRSRIRILQAPCGTQARLSTQAAALLQLLASRAGAVVAREDIDAVVGYTDVRNPRSADVAISRLRRQLKDCSNADRLVGTVPGVGYLLSMPAGQIMDVTTE